MLFKEEHIEPILLGRKTETRRIWKKPMVKVGRVYRCKTKMLSHDYFALIRIIDYYKQMLGEMSEENAYREGYNSLAKYKEKFIEIYGFWDDCFVVDVIRFKLWFVKRLNDG